MPFYKFDDPNSSTTVYNILMDYYTCDIANNINTITEGMDFNGLAEVAAAQWDKECTNLTLYNRDVTYNQDFYVKNTLSIEPEKNDAYHNTATDYPFAEPYIFTDNGSKDRFVIESLITTNISAGESIILKPGFEAKQGSSVNCSIQQGVCTNGMKMANNNYLGNNISQNNNITSLEVENNDSNSILNKNEFDEILDIEIYPNPSSTIVNLKCNNLTYSKIKNLKLVDVNGKKYEMEKSTKINIENFPSGCYQLIINLDDQYITKKIIKINDN